MSLHNLRMVSEDFGYLVREAPEAPCCSSCMADYEDEVAQEFTDYCCCTHGEKYATVYKGEVSWIEDGSEARYEDNRSAQLLRPASSGGGER